MMLTYHISSSRIKIHTSAPKPKSVEDYRAKSSYHILLYHREISCATVEKYVKWRWVIRFPATCVQRKTSSQPFNYTGAENGSKCRSEWSIKRRGARKQQHTKKKKIMRRTATWNHKIAHSNTRNLPSFSSSKSKSSVSLIDLKKVVTAPLGTSSREPIEMPSIWNEEIW